MGNAFCCKNTPTNTIKNEKEEEEEEEHFQKLKKVGDGAFGEAFLIISEKTKLYYIAKIIKIQYSNEKNMIKAFGKAFSEVEILKQCHHPNIILFKEVFKQRINNDLTLYIITEYCDDGDLNKKSKEKENKGEHFEESQLICWLMQLSLALKYLHEKKIIHRDIKPSNIFLTKKGYIKLGDFSLSQIFNNTEENINSNKNTNITNDGKEYTPDKENLKRIQSLKGTPVFLAPEVLVKHEYTEKTDIWALGITFYYLMNFSYPYKGDTFANFCKNIILDKRETPSHKDLYSQEFINLIESMLYRKPEERPNAESILKSKVIRDRMAPFLTDNKFDYKTASKFIKQYEENKNKIKNKKKKEENEILEKNDIISQNITNIKLSQEDIQKQEQHKEEKEQYEMNKLMTIVNDCL